MGGVFGVTEPFATFKLGSCLHDSIAAPFCFLATMASMREVKDLARLTASGPDAPHMPAINRSGSSLVLANVASSSGSVSRPSGPIVPAKPGSARGSRVSASGRSEDDDEDVEADGVDAQTECSEHKRPLGRVKEVKHFSYAVQGCDLKCKMCGIACTDESPTAVYDLPEFEGLAPWRSYQTVNEVRNEDGSLTLVKKPSGKLCRLCDSVYFDMNLQDVHGTIGAYCKKPRDHDVHKKFMNGRKAIIEHRLELAASGQVQSLPRAKLPELKAVMAGAARVESFSSREVHTASPSVAFVELEHWDEQIDGELDPSRIVTTRINGKMMRGIWKQHGRVGVHIQTGIAKTGFAETHLEAENSGPLGEERVKNRVSALAGQIADFANVQAPLVAPAPALSLSGLDPLALMRALGMASSNKTSSTASGQCEDVESSDSGSDGDADSAPTQAGGSWMRQQMGHVPSDGPPAKLPAKTATGNKGAKALPAPVPKSVASEPGSSRSRPPKASTGSALSVGSGMPSLQSGVDQCIGSAPEVELCDGRNLRLLQNLQETTAKAQEILGEIKQFFANPPRLCRVHARCEVFCATTIAVASVLEWPAQGSEGNC